ncbi:MAG TPA: hypothetical protein VK558_16950 [Patescibacteria group bacterium]|nr:hypothetical protein [Patescibacteria group bacterium]
MTSNLPKPPPKAPPRALPGAAPAAAPAAAPVAAAPPARPATPPAAPAAAKAPPPVVKSAPPAKVATLPGKAAPAANAAAKTATAPTPIRPQAQPQAAAQPQIATPTIDLRGLPASLAQMAEAVSLLDAVLSAENLLLRGHDAHGVAAMQDRKLAVTRLYQERLRAFLKDEGRARDLTAEQRDKVVALVRAMEARAEENANLLKANMNAIERLFETINSSMLKKKNPDVLYSRKGVMTGSMTTNGAALAFNKTF